MELSLELVIPNTPLTNGQAERVVSEEVLSALEGSVNICRGEIVPLAPNNTGALRGSIQTEVKGTPVEMSGRVFTTSSYAQPIESGATWPGAWPPRAPLELWVRRRLGVPEKDVRSVAFLVARKLKDRGLVARQFFKKGFDRAKPRVYLRWAQALARIKQRLEGA